MSQNPAYNESELLTHLAEGKEQAFKRVYELYYTQLTYFVLKVLHDRQAAEDVAVETFISLLRTKPEFERIYQLKAWLFTTARNKTLDVLRQKKREEASHAEVGQSEQTQVEEAIDHALIRSEAMNIIYQEIEALPPQIRQVIILSFVEGQSVKDIARHLGTAVQTVQNQKARGLQLLRTSIIRNQLLSPALLWASWHLLHQP